MRGLLSQVPAVLGAELGQQRRNMKFHGAHRNAQASGDFLVNTVVDELDQDFVLAGAKGHGGKNASPKAQKLFRFPGYPADQIVVRRDVDRVVRRRITPHGAGEGQEGGGALDRGGFISFDLDIESGNSGMFVTNEKDTRRLREPMAPAAGVSVSVSLPPNNSTSRSRRLAAMNSGDGCSVRSEGSHRARACRQKS